MWRERAQFAQLGQTGDKKQPTIVYNRPFTRFELLNMFPPIRFAVEEILKSDRPKRAQKYWIKAIDELKKHGFISHHEVVKEKAFPREGWQDIWYKQEQLDIRPGGVSKQNAIEISKAATVKRRNSTRRKNLVTKET